MYSESIMMRLREMNGLEEDDMSKDEELIEENPPFYVLDSILKSEGIIGYTSKILDWIKEIYGVQL